MSFRPILCVVGPSGSGKTTLLAGLISRLTAEGLTVAGIKHAASGPDAGPAGKDSARLADAGARPAIVSGPDGVIVRGERADPGLLDLAEGFRGDCDLVLAEGHKQSPHDKIVMGGAEDQALSSVRLVVGDGPDLPAGALHRHDVAGVARWVRQWASRRRRLGAGVFGAVLAGGQSRRMGLAKADLRLRGRSVLANLIELLGGRLEQVWVIGRRAEGGDLPRCVRWHLDLRAGRGPLGGIATALRVAQQAEARSLLAVACDMPALAGEAVDLLLENRRPEAPASALRNPQTGRLEPLAAVYEPRALADIERALDAGRLSATELLEAVGAHAIDVPAELADQLVNVNTPEDLQRLQEKR